METANIKVIFTLENVVYLLEFERLKGTVRKFKNTTPSPVSLGNGLNFVVLLTCKRVRITLNPLHK